MREFFKEIHSRVGGRKLNISFVNDEQRPSGSNLRELAKNPHGDECSRGIAWRAGKNELYLRTGVERMRGLSGIRYPAAIRGGDQIDHFRAVGFGRYRVHAVSGRELQYSVFARTAEGTNQKLDAFVAAAGDKNLFGRDAGVRRISLYDGFRLRLRIAVEAFGLKRHRHRFGRLVGIEPNVSAPARRGDNASGRLVGREFLHFGARKTLRGFSNFCAIVSQFTLRSF